MLTQAINLLLLHGLLSNVLAVEASPLVHGFNKKGGEEEPAILKEKAMPTEVYKIIAQLQVEVETHKKALQHANEGKAATAAKLKEERTLTAKLQEDLQQMRKEAKQYKRLAAQALAPHQSESQGVLRTQPTTKFNEKLHVEVGSEGQINAIKVEESVAQQKRGEPRSHTISEADACYDDQKFLAEFQPYVDFISKHMAKEESNTGLKALTETERPLGDGSTWQWSDDNGKALELLSLEAFNDRPEVRKLRGQVSEFIMGNAPPPFIFRRRMAASLQVHSKEDEDVKLETSGLKFFSDTKGSRIKQAVKFHDFRNVASDIEHGEHYVKFNLADGREVAVTLSKETCMAGGINPRQDKASFLWFQDHALVHPDTSARLAKITLFAEQRSAEAFTRLEVVAQSEDHKEPLKNLSVGFRFFAPDDKSNNHPTTYQMIHLSNPEGAKTCENEACAATKQTHDRAEWVAMSEKVKYGEAHATFVRLEHSKDFEGVTATMVPGTDNKFLSEMALWHNLGDVNPSQSKNFGLKMVVTAGHMWDDIHSYDEVLRNLESSRFNGLDLSVSYDVGAEVNGVVSALMQDCKNLDAGKYSDEKNTCNTQTREWVKAHVNTYLNRWVTDSNENIFIRGASFMLMSCGKMLQLPKKYRLGNDTAVYSACVEKLSDKVIALKPNGNYWLDDLAAAMLGHSIAYKTFPEQSSKSRWQVNDILKNKIGLNPEKHSASDFPNTPNGPNSESDWGAHVAQSPVKDNMAWSFKAGLVARAARVALDTPGLLDPENVEPASALVAATTDYMKACIDEEYENEWQIKSSFPSAETNSETQAWTVLGLIPTCRFPGL